MAEVRLANTPIHELDPSLTKDILYTRLVYILSNNAIDEIGILPFLPDKEQETERSSSATVPQYPFIVQEHGTKLGIPIFLLGARFGRRLCRAQVCDPANTLERFYSPTLVEGPRTRRVIGATSCIMLLCPDSFMAINARKQLVLEGHVDAQREIKYLDMILTFPRNCKSSGAWHHRKWLLCHIYKDHETVPIDHTVVEEQLQVCHQAAERYSKCYYAWTMRHWLVEQLGKHWWLASMGSGSGTLQGELEPLERELDRMRSHMNRGISDHSAQQHLQQCMLHLGGRWVVQQVPVAGEKDMVIQWSRKELEQRQRKMQELGVSGSPVKSVLQIKDTPRRGSYAWVVRLWATELERIRGLIQSYPGHESLWYHLRFVYYGLRWLDSETSVPAGGGDGEAQIGFVSHATEDAFVQTIVRGHATDVGAGANQVSAFDRDARDQQARHCQQYLLFVRRLDEAAMSKPEN